MQQKSKLALVTLSIVAFLIVGFIILNNSKNSIPIAVAPNHPIPKTQPEKSKPLVTTSPIIGDKTIDSSINTILNNALSDDNLDKEFSDTDSELSNDEESLNQINNLSNKNDL